LPTATNRSSTTAIYLPAYFSTSSLKCSTIHRSNFFSRYNYIHKRLSGKVKLISQLRFISWLHYMQNIRILRTHPVFFFNTRRCESIYKRKIKRILKLMSPAKLLEGIR
jgi:hypothetical protein